MHTEFMIMYAKKLHKTSKIPGSYERNKFVWQNCCSHLKYLCPAAQIGERSLATARNILVKKLSKLAEIPGCYSSD
jgi:hypothetical protein